MSRRCARVEDDPGKCFQISQAFWEWSGIRPTMPCCPINFISRFVAAWCRLCGSKAITDHELIAIMIFPEKSFAEIKKLIELSYALPPKITVQEIMMENISYSDSRCLSTLMQKMKEPVLLSKFKVPLSREFDANYIPKIGPKKNTDYSRLEEINQLLIDVRDVDKTRGKIFNKDYQYAMIGIRKRWIKLGLKRPPGLRNCSFHSDNWALYDKDIQNRIVTTWLCLKQMGLYRDVIRNCILPYYFIPAAAATTTTVSAVEQNVCVYCKKVQPGKRCARCKKAKYCDVGCQRAHWVKHKNECVSLGGVTCIEGK